MSAGSLYTADVAQSSRPTDGSEMLRVQPAQGWSPERFAREQIRGLVRQIFSLNPRRPMRQIVFSAVDPQSDVDSICRRVGETLAQERGRDVAVVGGWTYLVKQGRRNDRKAGSEDWHRNAPLKDIAIRVTQNCWLVPAEEYLAPESLHANLAEIRQEFEYSVVAAPAASESGEAVAMAEFADGLVLVLSAQHTRRATARKIKQAMDEAQVRLLGLVLADREFPIPDALYRRL